MTTVKETTNIHKLIIFCFSVNDAYNNSERWHKAEGTSDWFQAKAKSQWTRAQR